MPKAKKLFAFLTSVVGTGTRFLIRKSKESQHNKLSLMKFDPVLQRHVLFKEEKYKSGKVIQKSRRNQWIYHNIILKIKCKKWYF